MIVANVDQRVSRCPELSKPSSLALALEATVKVVGLFYDATGPASSHAIGHLLQKNKITTLLVGRQRALL